MGGNKQRYAKFLQDYMEVSSHKFKGAKNRYQYSDLEVTYESNPEYNQ